MHVTEILSANWLSPALIGLFLLIFFAPQLKTVFAYRDSENRPKLFLHYDALVASQYGLTYSGLFLKNDGETAFNVRFECAPTRCGYTLKLDDPPSSIEKGCSYPVDLAVCKLDQQGRLIPLGGILSGRVKDFFRRIAADGDDAFTITMKCEGFDRMETFCSKTTLSHDPWTDVISTK